MRNLTISLVLTGFMATQAIASDDHSGHSDHSDHSSHSEKSHGDHSEMHSGVHTEVTINSISDGVVNVSHGPIPEIGWPAMTMDLNLLEGAEVGDVEAGEDAMMMLEKGEDGMFAVRALMPME